ncbi:class I SAM-dependent methyltransferase [Pseudolysinimonas sp.]|uniref:class I SAM-dependent methyltransferase n=1 Tax=Pseudolysinimonas sp. TaxID=2680009 RepID=UPI003F812583
MAWNHSIQYLPWVLRTVSPRSGRVANALDVGTGDGDLPALLTRVADEVVGLDADAGQSAAAAARHPDTRVRFVTADVLEAEVDGAPFAIVTCLAALHHMDLEAGLTRLRDLTAPGGVLVIVGLATDATALDRVRSALAVPVSGVKRRVLGWYDHGAPMQAASLPSTRVREAAARILPGSRYRTRLYWRYSLVWRAPSR